jgi:hypothetical protein
VYYKIILREPRFTKSEHSLLINPSRNLLAVYMLAVIRSDVVVANASERTGALAIDAIRKLVKWQRRISMSMWRLGCRLGPGGSGPALPVATVGKKDRRGLMHTSAANTDGRCGHELVDRLWRRFRAPRRVHCVTCRSALWPNSQALSRDRN